MAHINDEGLNIIMRFEGDRLRAYPDPGSGGDPWTIGYGHTASVHPGEAITPDQALAFLRSDVAGAESRVSRDVEVQLNPNQFSALVSFVFNTGTLGHGVLAAVNSERFLDVRRELAKWRFASGQSLTGLASRRAVEATLFEKPWKSAFRPLPFKPIGKGGVKTSL